LAGGATAAAFRAVLIFGLRLTMLFLASRIAAWSGAVDLPTVAVPADIKDLLTSTEFAGALPQRDRLNGNNLRRHASPGGLDNGKPYVSAFRRSTAGDLNAYGRPNRDLAAVTAGSPCPSRQQHHTSVTPRRRVWGEKRMMRMDAEGCGNGGAVESVEKQKQLSHSSHSPLGNLAKAARFPHSHSPRRRSKL
jgi:hypothetical protein